MGDSDSENDGSQVNITRLVIRPPGHTGKAQKGHIAFEAGFECGNLGRVDFISEHEIDLYIRPDTCNPRHRFWFNFTVSNTQKDQRLIFNLVNISKWRNLLSQGLTPVVKSTTRPMWQRMPTTHVFYHRSPLHNKNYVLSWAFSFDLEGEVYQFAMCQPYSYSRHLLYLQNLFSNSYKFVHRDVLGLSVMEREIDLITISHPNNLLHRIQHDGDNPRKVKVVFILGRVHPGETPSSFVIQGFIDFLTSSHEVAICLREHIVFKIVPMLNPDGVFLGNQRCNLLGQDLNRAWADTQRLLHPELDQLKKQLLYYDNHPTYKLDMVLDVHAHTALTGLFIYGNSYEDVYRYERHIVFPRFLSLNCEDFSVNNTIYNSDVRKNGSVRRHMTTYLSEEVNTYTLEVSLLGYEDRESQKIVPYTDVLYSMVGRNLARAYWDYYKILGIVPLEEKVLESEEGQTNISREGTKIGNLIHRSFNMERLREVAKQRESILEAFVLEEIKKKRLEKNPSSSSAKVESPVLGARNRISLNLIQYPSSDDLDDITSSSLSNLRLDLEDVHEESDEERKMTHADPSLDILEEKNKKELRRTITFRSIQRHSKLSQDMPEITESESDPLLENLRLDTFSRSSSRSSLGITGLGPTIDMIYSPSISFSSSSSILITQEKKVGGGGVLSTAGNAPRVQYLRPYLNTPLDKTPTLTVIDFSEMSRPKPKPTMVKKRRKRIGEKAVTKEEFFNRLYAS